jgi:hypothetical protein
MDATTITTVTFKVFNVTAVPETEVGGTVIYDTESRTAKFTPTAVLGLDPTTNFQARLLIGITDSIGDPLTPTSWNFTTGTATDNTIPTAPLATVNPSSGAVNVSVATNMTVLFSEAMDPTTVDTLTFIVRDSASNAVAGTVSLTSDGRTATFNPTANQAVGTQHTVTVSGATDLAGRPADPVTWSFTTEATAGGGVGVDGGINCFIATAAYGSYLDPHVKVLRDFRDRYLITNPVGRAFVDFYYRNSPPVAEYIKQHEPLRTATRWVLTPVVFVIEYPFGLGFLFLAGIVVFRRRKR